MKKSTLSILSLLLAAIMLAGSLASCTTPEETTGGTSTATEESTTKAPDPTESTSNTGESDASEESFEVDTDTDTDSDTSVSDSNEASTSTSTSTSNSSDEETTEEQVEVTAPSLDDIAYGDIIGNANALKNGVNAYFTDGKRTDFMLENQNMSLEYALAAGKDQQITALRNTKGACYVQSTADVFVKLTSGATLYASDSTRPATANLYRLGYYMYEARFEEQNFLGAYNEKDSLLLSIASVNSQHVKVSDNEDGSLHVIVTNDTDPYIKLKNINYSAADYPYLSITLKASSKSARGITVYLETDTHSMGSSQGAIISPSDEYMTYIVPLYRTSWYEGTVKGLRLDFDGGTIRGEGYDIKEVKLLGGETEALPQQLGLNRSFFVYSDKLHHMLQIATDSVATENIASVGMETRIAKDTVAKVVAFDKNGLHDSLADVDWDSAEYVGFDIKDAGIFGYILPAGEKTDKLEVISDGDDYVIIQSRTPENGTIQPSGVWNAETKRYDALIDDNANDFYMGQRLYTDESHDFTKFLHEAHTERNPLTVKNFILNKRDSSYECYYECPECGETFDTPSSQCPVCYEKITPIEHPNMYFIGYDALRGLYNYRVPSESFNAPYFQYPNKYIDLTFSIIADKYERSIYFMASSTSGCLECAAILDENRMMLPIPVEVGKNFSEGSGERNLWNIQDNLYGESIIPIIVKPGTKNVYTMLNLYQNWGQFPLKQVSWIQFYAPYYHLSTGVTETNCIVPYYSCKNARGLGTLPDHRAMSAHLWSGQPQHTSGGSHRWLMYTDADGVFSASENTLDYIDSYGPVYADVYMDFLSDDGKIKVSYTHMEFPQTDENRAFYEMKYEVLDDVSFENFAEDFCFYDVTDNDAEGSYINVGYLNENNNSVIETAAKEGESFKYVLGTECPYFSFFNMPDYDRDSTSAEGFTNLSFLIHNYEIIINGEKSNAKLAIINEDNRVRLTLDLGETTLKKGDSFVINAIVMPWGDENLDYSVVGDKNVRDVRENTLLNPLTPTAVEDCEVLDSVFLPKIKSTNGKSAAFNLKGGQNNVAVRVYGFTTLTTPRIQELVDGEWVDYHTSSAYKPDRFGNAHYYDGYSVHYDADGTFSYAFIVPMDYTDADGRTFRVVADTAFEGWPSKLPEIEQDDVELPMNVFVDSDELLLAAQSQAGKMFGGINMAPDGSYVTLSSNSKAQEAYFTVWPGDGQKTVTGQYFVMKYRLPNENNRKHRYFEIFTTTKSSISCFGISNALINDGEWHTLVIDLASFESDNFMADEGGEYKARSIRIDLFNEYYADGNSIDLAFFGASDSLEEIRGYEKVDSINVFKKGGSITSYDKNGNEIETPSDSTGSTTVEGFNFYLDASSIADSARSDDGHIGSTVLAEDKSYVTLHYAKGKNRVESYITLFTGNRKPTGQYLIFKYRAQKQAGTIEFYCSTEKDSAASGMNFNLNSDKNYTFVADDLWHTVVVDLSKVLSDDTFKANSASEYIARFIRIDLFNFDTARDDDYSVDIAYLGFADSYEDAISHDENTWFYDGEKSINASTGAALTKPVDNSPITDATSSVPGYNVYIDPSKITAAGKNTLWMDTISTGTEGDISFTTVKNHLNAEKDDNKNETYFSVYSTSEKKASGQYAVIKYRANVQQGSITLWSSTQNAGPTSGSSFDLSAGNGLFIADNQWHIVVVDLSKLISTFTDVDGKYVATHLRIDFFNFGSPRDPADTVAQVDVAHIGFCDDFTEILCSDKSVDEILFYNGQLSKYSTATGELTEGEGNIEPEPEPNPTFEGNHFNATAIIQASQVGGGHIGNEELIEDGNVARIYNCVDTNAANAARIESYFYLLSNNIEETGRYLVLKYRAKHQVGYMQIYASTQNSSASDNISLTLEKGLFVADNEWKIVIIDLDKVLATYTPDDSGKYFAKHLRIDLFNFGSPRTDSDVAYVDLAYVGLSNDLADLITSDTSVEKAFFYDGSLTEYFTASGETIEYPNYIANAAALAGQTEGTGLDRTLSADNGYTSYALKAGASDAYSYVLRTDINVNAPKAPTGQYLMIKYKTTYTGSWTVYLGANNGHTSASNDGDKFSITQKDGTAGAIVSDGEWQYLIIDLASYYESAGLGGFKSEDGTTNIYQIDYLRFGFWPSASTPIDIAYVAIADNVQKLVNYGGMDSYTYSDSHDTVLISETVTVK